MNQATTNSKRIFKNTIVLYIRMIGVMLIGLYSSRVILQALGVEDFGLYNVVGGVVGLLSFFNTTMAKTTQRFLNVAMVKGEQSLASIFSSSITVHLMFVALFLILGETLGLWFLNAKINIPEGREVAANIVYQAAVLSFCTSIIMTPYSAAVIAYEKMTFVAVVSIVDAVLRLGIALILLAWSKDRLALYGILLFMVAVLNFVLYFLYCRKKYPVFKFRLSLDKENFKQIFSFVTWTILGQFAIVGCNQGNVVLVNMFHSLVANAAMSVGNQINHAITNLTTNFQTAFNPQITKSYAEKNFDYLKSLVYTTSKISFCILYVVALPIAFNIDWVLDIWLDEVPEMSNTFAILFMTNGILNALSAPFNFTVLSSGKIRNYQIVVSLIFLADLPIVYILFSMGMPPTTVLWVKNAVMIVAVFVRIFFASRIVPSISAFSYAREVLSLLLLTVAITLLLASILNKYSDSTIERLLFTVIIEAVCILSMWFVCLKQNERKSLLNYIKIRHA